MNILQLKLKGIHPEIIHVENDKEAQTAYDELVDAILTEKSKTFRVDGVSYTFAPCIVEAVALLTSEENEKRQKQENERYEKERNTINQAPIGIRSNRLF